MSHECDDCEQTFETLSRLRLHDCGNDSGNSASNDGTAPSFEATSTESESAREPDHEELNALLARAADGDRDALDSAVATYELAMERALEERGDDAYRDVFWPYYERVGDALDVAAREDGWSVLLEVIEAYDPSADEEIPLATPAIANAVGRHTIRTRVADGVETLPAGALSYLDAVATEAGETEDVAREETHAYGWGIGHPDHDVVARLQARARSGDGIYTVNPQLEHAFYADQHAAVAALEELVRDDQIDGTLPGIRGDDVPHRRFLVDCVYSLQFDDYWPTTPRYWDWHDELDYAFQLDEAVERRIRDLVAEMGFDKKLPEEWTFEDLGL